MRETLSTFKPHGHEGANRAGVKSLPSLGPPPRLPVRDSQPLANPVQARFRPSTEAGTAVGTRRLVPERRLVKARVALSLLDAMRELDRPGEVLDDEDITITMPRRLGLSDVVDSQIRRYQQDARRNRRVPESEVRDLIRLVARRPDAGDLFHRVGRQLARKGRRPPLGGILPDRIRFAAARREARRQLQALFGRGFARSVGVPFQLEVLRPVLVDGDEGGGACSLVTGLSQAVVDRHASNAREVTHTSCRARGEARCLWSLAPQGEAGSEVEEAGSVGSTPSQPTRLGER
jgi:hypothetical protein